MPDGNFVVLSKAHTYVKSKTANTIASDPKYDGVEGKKINLNDLSFSYLAKYNPIKQDYRIWSPEVPSPIPIYLRFDAHKRWSNTLNPKNLTTRYLNGLTRHSNGLLIGMSDTTWTVLNPSRFLASNLGERCCIPYRHYISNRYSPQQFGEDNNLFGSAGFGPVLPSTPICSVYY